MTPLGELTCYYSLHLFLLLRSFKIWVGIGATWIRIELRVQTCLAAMTTQLVYHKLWRSSSLLCFYTSHKWNLNLITPYFQLASFAWVYKGNLWETLICQFRWAWLLSITPTCMNNQQPYFLPKSGCQPISSNPILSSLILSKKWTCVPFGLKSISNF